MNVSTASVRTSKSYPHTLQQLVAGEHQSRVARQHFQQAELAPGQRQRCAVQPGHTGPWVDHQPPARTWSVAAGGLRLSNARSRSTSSCRANGLTR